MNFNQFLQSKKILPKSIRRYNREANKYIDWLNVRNLTAETSQTKHLLDYLQYIKNLRKLSNSTLSHILNILKNYHQYLYKTQKINNIASLIKIRGVEKRAIYNLLTVEELEQISDIYYIHTQEYTPTSKELLHFKNYDEILTLRYIALTLIVYQALQIKEIETLTRENFDLRKGKVNIYKTNKGTERTLLLDPSQISVLIKYFETSDNNKIIQNRSQFDSLGATLKKRHPKYKNLQQLRISRMTIWLKLYGLRKTQYLAGHKNIKTTEKLQVGEYEILQNQTNKYHPL